MKTRQPKRVKPVKTAGFEPKVTVHVTIKDTPPDAARLARQRRAIETILAILTRD